tara:strand:- start:4323 stop:5192 length:870 start_codon:yes stop_codon:yes gene_type:complete
MIGRSFCLVLALALVPLASFAADVHKLDNDSYYKNKKRVSKVLESVLPDSVAWVYRSRHNGWVDRNHYNKKRENVLMLPDASGKDLTLVVWLHGLNGFSEKTFRRVYNQINDLVEKDYSVAVAIPEMPWSTNTKTKRGRQGMVWNGKGSFKGYVEDTIDILRWHYLMTRGYGLGKVDVVVVGHSAGGSALASASSEGSICQLNITSVVWSDATYGSWLKRAHRGCLGKSEAKKIVLVRRWDKPHNRASRFLKSLKGHEYDFRILPRRQYRHSRIGNEALELSNLFPVGC